MDIQRSRLGATTMLRPIGLLDLASAPSMRDALLRSIADEPAGVVVSTDRLRVHDLAMMTVFATVTRQTMAWPRVPVVLVAEDGPIAALVADSALPRFVSVFASVAAAVEALEGLPQRVLADLADAHGTDDRIAPFVREQCAGWGITELTADATLVATELLAVLASDAALLRLAPRPGALTIALRGAGPDPVTTVGPVERLAPRWGSTPTWTGERVLWAVLPIR